MSFLKSGVVKQHELKLWRLTVLLVVGVVNLFVHVSISLHKGQYDIDLEVIILQHILTLKVLVATIDAQWKGMGDVGSARYDHKGFKLQ